MAQLVDNKGKLFGKINIVDLFCIIFVLSFLPAVFFVGKKIVKLQFNQPINTVYQVKRSCPNCGVKNTLTFPLGVEVIKTIEVCGNCEVVVDFKN